MQITVKLFATFREGRFVTAVREYPAGTRIADIIQELQINEAEVGMILVNSKHVESDEEIREGMNLAIFPVVGGG
jgi:molybdopterin converting factor small subunit